MGKTFKATVDWLGMVENGGDLPAQDVDPSVNGGKAQTGTEIIQGGMLPEIEVSALTDDSYNTLSDPQQKVYDMYVNKYGTRQTIPTGKNTAMHWEDALRMVEEQGLKTLSHESDPIFNTLFNRGSDAGNFTPHAKPIFNKIIIPDYKAQDYSSFDSFTFLDGWHSIDELEKIDIEKIKNAKTDNDLDKFSDLEWKVFKKYNKSYTYGHEEQVKSGEKDFTYLEWDQRHNDDMLYGYIPDDVDLQEMINNKIDKHERYVADIPGNRGIDDVIAEVAHLTESNRTGSKVDLAISLLRDWQRIKKMPYKKFISHFKPFEGWENDPNMKGKPLPKSWSSLWDHIDSARYSDPKHYEYITHQIIEPWLRREYDYNPTGVKKDNPMPKSKYDLFKDGGQLPIAQDGFNFNKSNSYGQGPNFFEKEPMTWTNQEIMDVALDAGAVFHPGFDFAHAFTKFREGEYTDAALYAAFGIIPFSAGPLVKGTKKAFNYLKNINPLGKNAKIAKELSKNLDAAPLGNTASKVDEKIIPVKNTDTSKDAVLSTKQIQKSIAHEKFVKQSDIFKSNVPLTRVLDADGLVFKNGKLFGNKQPHYYNPTHSVHRNTSHWSYGHVGNPGHGDWSKQTTAIINDFENLKGSGHAMDFNPTDTYFYSKGNFEIPSNSLILTRDKKLYNQIKKDTNIKNIKLIEDVTDDQFIAIVNKFGKTETKGKELFENYLRTNWEQGIDVAQHKPASSYKAQINQGDNFSDEFIKKYGDPNIFEGRPGWDPNDMTLNDPFGGGNSKLHNEDPTSILERIGNYDPMASYGHNLSHPKLIALSEMPKPLQINEMDKLLKTFKNTDEAITIQNQVAELNGFKSYKEFKNSVDMTNFKKYGGALTKAQDGTEVSSERNRFIKFLKDNEGGYDYIRAKDSAIKKMGEDGEWDGESYYKIFDEGTQKYYPYFLNDEKGATIGHGHHNNNVYEDYSEGISIAKAEELLNLDVDNKMSDTEIWWTSKYGDGEWGNLDESTQYLLGDYAYNTGHIRNYKLFADAIKRGDYETAIKEYKRKDDPGGSYLGRNKTYLAEYLQPWIDIQKEKTAIAPPLNEMSLPIGVFPMDGENTEQPMTLNKTYMEGISPFDYQVPPAVQDNTRVGNNVFGGWKTGGELPKAQFGRHSIMSGDAYGTRVSYNEKGQKVHANGMLGDIYKKTGFDKFSKKYMPEGPHEAITSGVLDVLSIPGNLVTEAVEYFGERGDKEFNFSDAMPGWSGDFSFTNANDEPMKTVSQTTDADGKPLVDNFWGGLSLDIITDPSTWIGAGLIKNFFTKGSKVLPKKVISKSLVTTKELDNIVEGGGDMYLQLNSLRIAHPKSAKKIGLTTDKKVKEIIINDPKKAEKIINSSDITTSKINFLDNVKIRVNKDVQSGLNYYKLRHGRLRTIDQDNLLNNVSNMGNDGTTSLYRYGNSPLNEGYFKQKSGWFSADPMDPFRYQDYRGSGKSVFKIDVENQLLNDIYRGGPQQGSSFHSGTTFKEFDVPDWLISLSKETNLGNMSEYKKYLNTLKQRGGEKYNDGGSLPKAQMGNFPLGIKGQGFSNIQVPGINWAEGVPELTGTEARQGVNVSGLNLAKDFNLTDNLKLSLSNPAFVYARPTLDNMPVSDGGTFKGFPFEPRIGLTYNFRDGGSLPKAQTGEEIDLTQHMNTLIERINSPAFKDQVYAQHKNLHGYEPDWDWDAVVAKQIELITKGYEGGTYDPTVMTPLDQDYIDKVAKETRHYLFNPSGDTVMGGMLGQGDIDDIGNIYYNQEEFKEDPKKGNLVALHEVSHRFNALEPTELTPYITQIFGEGEYSDKMSLKQTNAAAEEERNYLKNMMRYGINYIPAVNDDYNEIYHPRSKNNYNWVGAREGGNSDRENYLTKPGEGHAFKTVLQEELKTLGIHDFNSGAFDDDALEKLYNMTAEQYESLDSATQEYLGGLGITEIIYPDGRTGKWDDESSVEDKKNDPGRKENIFQYMNEFWGDKKEGNPFEVTDDFGQELTISKYGGQHDWALDLRPTTTASHGKEVKNDDIYSNDRYSKSASKYKKMLPKYQEGEEWNPTDPNTPFTYEDLYGENWETVINDLKAGEQKVYPWQGSRLRNQTSTGKDKTYWNEDGTFKTADQLIAGKNQFMMKLPTRKSDKIKDLDIALQNSNRIKSEAEFSEMNILQQKSLSEAMGMSVDASNKIEEKVPFKTEEEGNVFRSWINDTYSEYATEIDLDTEGSFDNDYIQEAWNTYGQDYLKLQQPDVPDFKVTSKEMNEYLNLMYTDLEGINSYGNSKRDIQEYNELHDANFTDYQSVKDEMEGIKYMQRIYNIQTKYPAVTDISNLDLGSRGAIENWSDGAAQMFMALHLKDPNYNFGAWQFKNHSTSSEYADKIRSEVAFQEHDKLRQIVKSVMPWIVPETIEEAALMVGTFGVLKAAQPWIMKNVFRMGDDVIKTAYNTQKVVYPKNFKDVISKYKGVTTASTSSYRKIYDPIKKKWVNSSGDVGLMKMNQYPNAKLIQENLSNYIIESAKRNVKLNEFYIKLLKTQPNIGADDFATLILHHMNGSPKLGFPNGPTLETLKHSYKLNIMKIIDEKAAIKLINDPKYIDDLIEQYLKGKKIDGINLDRTNTRSIYDRIFKSENPPIKSKDIIENAVDL